MVELLLSPSEMSFTFWNVYHFTTAFIFYPEKTASSEKGSFTPKYEYSTNFRSERWKKL